MIYYIDTTHVAAVAGKVITQPVRQKPNARCQDGGAAPGTKKSRLANWQQGDEGREEEMAFPIWTNRNPPNVVPNPGRLVCSPFSSMSRPRVERRRRQYLCVRYRQRH